MSHLADLSNQVGPIKKVTPAEQAAALAAAFRNAHDREEAERFAAMLGLRSSR